jgi:hypothetical protein
MAIGYGVEHGGKPEVNVRYTPENRKELYYMWETQIKDSIQSGSTRKQVETIIHVIRQITPELDDKDKDVWYTLEPSLKEAEDEFLRHYPLLVPEFKYMMVKPIEDYRDLLYLRRLQRELNRLFDKLTHKVDWLFLKKHKEASIK